MPPLQSILAASPQYFECSGVFKPKYPAKFSPEHAMTNKGPRLVARLQRTDNTGIVFMALVFKGNNQSQRQTGIFLRYCGANTYARIWPYLVQFENYGPATPERSIYLSRDPTFL